MNREKNKEEEADLLLRIKAGDQKAFKALFYLHNTRFCLWAYKITGNKQAAEDIVQDFFIRFWNKRESLFFSPSFLSYAYRSIYNASLNYLRDNEKYVYDLPDAHIPLKVDTDEEDQNELEAELMASIEQLPERCREIFVMVALEKKTHDEVARHFGISINTVKVQVSKAYRTLRQKFNTLLFLFF